VTALDAEAQALAERCAPHVPPALLAHLYRAGQPFPAHSVPLARSGFQHVLDLWGWTGELLNGGMYIRFDGCACHTILFEPNTDRGIAHAYRVAFAHKPDCCAERAARYTVTGVPAPWPDSLDE
jgi:hypothetical protein